ncbi:unnamed protein product [Acanthosepion pharaonis]|uniref:ILCR1 Ig-like domain-containing protein n=1 Tax=Acanthosepion pharaonis TaxID=158019 RepID=A0A812D872_ACAPH|nr:unnamed protein product [Sepia pharaonis]
MYSVYITSFVHFILLEVLLIQSSELLTVFTGKYTLLNTSDCTKDLPVYRPNPNGQWPSKISSAEYETFVSDRQMRLKITWKADITNPDICHILDYTNAITNSSSGLFYFRIVFSIAENMNYTAELSPLPRHDETLVHTSQFDSVDCSIFAPAFSHDYDGRYLNVTFSKGPDKCNYRKYEIGVYKSESKNKIAEIIVPTQDNVKNLHAFTELKISKGYYHLMLSVFEENANSCTCRNKQNQCRNSKSYFPRMQHRKKQESNQFLFLLGIANGLLLLIALTLSITYWKLSVHLMVKKRGLVLLIDDHEHHTNAVIKLVNYLNGCHLKMDLASTFLKNYDIPDQLLMICESLKSDFVLLVLSSALQKRMEAWNKEQDYVEFFRETNSNILTKQLLEVFLKSNKTYVCKFDHMTEFGHWPKPCYSLPSGLTNMTADLNGQSFSQRLILLNYFKSNTLWSELQAAIKKAVMHEQSHVNWFQEKYVCPQNVAASHLIAEETL